MTQTVCFDTNLSAHTSAQTKSGSSDKISIHHCAVPGLLGAFKDTCKLAKITKLRNKSEQIFETDLKQILRHAYPAT